MLNAAVTDIHQSPNYSSGRPAPPAWIVIHHWGADGQAHQDVVNYLSRWGGDTSAHYVASAGRVTQLVADTDRAWHALDGNALGIGIECRPECSDADFETVISLIGAIRAQWGPLPLRPHSDFVATACPGRWAARLDELSARAQASSAAPASAPAQAPTTRKDKKTMYLLRTVTPWGTYAYALVTLSGLGGARAIDQAEADVYYPALGVTPVGWQTWNNLVERAWQAHNAAIKAIGGAVDISIADEVATILDTVKAIGVPAPAEAIAAEKEVTA